MPSDKLLIVPSNISDVAYIQVEQKEGCVSGMVNIRHGNIEHPIQRQTEFFALVILTSINTPSG